MLSIGSNHLISQTGWNRCNISLSDPALVWLVRFNALSRPGPGRVVTRKDGLPTTLYPRMQLYSVLLVCILFFMLLRLAKIT